MNFYLLSLKRSVLFAVFLSVASVLNAQNILEVPVEWTNSVKTEYNGVEILTPCIKNQGNNNFKPNVNFHQEVSAKFSARLEVQSISTVAATKVDLDHIERFNIEIPSVLEGEMKVTNGAGKRYISVNFLPYIKEQGQIKRISSLILNVIPQSVATASHAKSFASESVLRQGTGDWYKISVDKDGVYKIDKAFLESLGIDIATLNPQSINIYGNADGKLPELNSVYRTDDLALNSIYVEGESDGVFDDADYILFYGWGPDRWYGQMNGTYEQDKNIYSRVACYFINVNPTNVPARIQNNVVSPGAPTHNITSYSFKAIHEIDAVNMVSAGQRWYGEVFDIDLTRNFNFQVPNAEPGFASSFKATIASNNSEPNVSFASQRYVLNGTTLLTTSLPTTPDWGRSTNTMPFTSGSSNLNLTITITRNSPNVLTYLDRIVLNTRRKLVFTDNQFNFSDLSTAGPGNKGAFTITGFPSTGFVWNVSDRHNPMLIQGTLTGSDYSFEANMDTITEFVASDGTNFFAPKRIGVVEPQNLHALEQAKYLLVTNKAFLGQANRLADLHRSNGTSVHVVTTEQIFNEFSSGSLDPTAIRMFAKMFYDRAISQPGTEPLYLCLFGDGTFDPIGRISGNNNYVPTFQVVGANSAEHYIHNIVTDDYFGMLDDNEAISSADKVDIGVGRLLISDNQMAKEQVDKIEHYMRNGSTLFAANNLNCVDGVSTSTFGDWRTKNVGIGDDEDYFVVNDLEPTYNYLKANHKEINVDKLYLDAYPRTVTAGGYRFPQVFDAITNRFESGALVINYVGHGGEVGLADERIVTIPQIQALTNIDNLPLVVSATCEFTKFDDPSRVSAGEWVALNPTGGGIALMTTTRSVYYTVNSNTVEEFYNTVFERKADFSPQTFGEITMNTKINVNDGDNKMAFCLIGDPGLTLALPRYKVVLDSVNGLAPSVEMDTIQALSKVVVKAHIEDFSGNVLTNFNGVATPSLYDKPKQLQTLGQNIGKTTVVPFELQRNVIYRGKASVVNGYFDFEFITPKDIDYSYGNGKFSLYANSNSTDGIGEEARVIVGGVNPNGLDDNVGPVIDLYLNSENFVNGGITNETPFLIAKIFDDNGVNTVGNGIGHDVTVIIDGKTSDPIVLNEYYSADLDTYQSGEIRYQFKELEAGPHTIVLKVWDVNNNSSEERLEFVVQENQELKLDHVLNYPNPFTTSTEFYFEHNQCCTDLESQVQIFTITGKLVKTINTLVNTSGYRSDPIPWDGKDEFGDQLAKGVYVYRLKVKTPEGMTAEKLEKLVLLR